MDQGLHEASFGLSELSTVATVNGNVAESRGAVVLNVDIRGVEQLNKNGDSTRVDKLLSVVVCAVVLALKWLFMHWYRTGVRHVKQGASRVSLHAHVF